MTRLLRRLPQVLILLTLGGLLAYGFWPTPIDVDVVESTRGPLLVTICDDGETRIKEKYVVSSPLDGKLLRLELHPGDQVTRGNTVIARVEPVDPTLLDARAVAQIEARVRAAEATKSQAQALLDQRREALERARHEFERVQELIRSKAVSEAEFDNADHQFRIAEADLRSAEFGIQVAAFELELAKAAMVRAHDQGSPGNHEAFEIPAPIDGTVLRLLHEDAGVIAAGAPLVELGDPREMEMKIELLSTDAVRVRPGHDIRVEYWGGNQKLEGKVRLVEPSAFLKVSALGVEEKRVNVIADFTSPYAERASLGDGFRLEACILVARIENAIKVPSGVLFRDGPSWCVFRIVNGRAQQVEVTLGQSNEDETEILDGLAVGERLILYPTDKVKPQVRVRTWKGAAGAAARARFLGGTTNNTLSL